MLEEMLSYGDWFRAKKKGIILGLIGILNSGVRDQSPVEDGEVVGQGGGRGLTVEFFRRMLFGERPANFVVEVRFFKKKIFCSYWGIES